MSNIRLTPRREREFPKLERWVEEVKDTTGAVLTIEMIEETFEKLHRPLEEHWVFSGVISGRQANKELSTTIYEDDTIYDVELKLWI